MPSNGPNSGATSACSGTLLSPAEVGPEVEAELPGIPEVPDIFPEAPDPRDPLKSRYELNRARAVVLAVMPVVPALRDSAHNG